MLAGSPTLPYDQMLAITLQSFKSKTGNHTEYLE